MSHRKIAVAHQESLLIGREINPKSWTFGGKSSDLQRSQFLTEVQDVGHRFSDLPSHESLQECQVQVNGAASELSRLGSLTEMQMSGQVGSKPPKNGLSPNGSASELPKNGPVKESMTAGSVSDLQRSGHGRDGVSNDQFTRNLQRNSPSSESASNELYATDSQKNGALTVRAAPSKHSDSFNSLKNRSDLSSPPAPPPSPPVSPRNALSIVPPFSIARNSSEIKSIGELCAAQEHLELWDKLFWEEFNADVAVHTTDGGVISSHSAVLAMASPVFKGFLQRSKARPYRFHLKGVPYEAAIAFIRFLYSSRIDEREMQKFSVHFLALGHAYCVPALKRLCTLHWEKGLINVENAVDLLQLARLCDAPRLQLLCYRLVLGEFKEVARTEAWRVMRSSNPQLEQELVEAVIDSDYKRQEKSRKLEEDKVYEQLHDAMEALVHICRDGCRTIGPHDKVFDAKQHGSCQYPACKGLESLVRHFAGCKLKVPGGCVHCKRMWQLLELHSRMCQESSCKVPLCGHFKNKIGQSQSKRDETRWRLLVNKVVSAKNATSAFSLAAVSARLEQVA